MFFWEFDGGQTYKVSHTNASRLSQYWYLWGNNSIRLFSIMSRHRGRSGPNAFSAFLVIIECVTLSDKLVTKSLGRSRDHWRKHHLGLIVFNLWNQQTMGSNCARTIDVRHDSERRPTTTETRVAYDNSNSTWHAKTPPVSDVNWLVLIFFSHTRVSVYSIIVLLITTHFGQHVTLKLISDDRSLLRSKQRKSFQLHFNSRNGHSTTTLV